MLAREYSSISRLPTDWQLVQCSDPAQERVPAVSGVDGHQRSYIERLQGKGFTYDEESGLFFLPVRVDREALALAIENEMIEDALEPLKKALDLCLGAKTIFDEILAAAKVQFKSEE